MNVHEMIRELKMQGQNDEDNWVCVLSGNQADAIIAALRAGQQMRSQFALPDESKDFPGMIAAIDFFEACKAWDRAVGSEK